jgi:hypothetical protein
MMKVRPRLTIMIAAAMAICAIGAVSALQASAETTEVAKFCKANEENCSMKNTYPAHTLINAETEPQKPLLLLTKLFSMTCNSTLSMQTLAESGTPLLGKATSLGLNDCVVVGSSPQQECTMTAVNLPYNVEFYAHNGGAVISSGGTGDPGITMVCGEIMNCTVTSASLKLGTGTNTQGRLAFTSTRSALAYHGSKCPVGDTLSATWVTSSPTSGYFTH